MIILINSHSLQKSCITLLPRTWQSESFLPQCSKRDLLHENLICKHISLPLFLSPLALSLFQLRWLIQETLALPLLVSRHTQQGVQNSRIISINIGWGREVCCCHILQITASQDYPFLLLKEGREGWNDWTEGEVEGICSQS